ncbi:FAD-containing oxidoreductase [Pelagibacterium sp.]|uniref:FAD-containing oxidoreductase n=1 Tax=Pelagibacterium sp. TaxID=1967288 RepID=UPI003A922BAE
MSERFDAIVVGAGQAGPSLAARLAGQGQSVALIERKLLGGTCVNTGCTPTKAMVASAYVAHMARRSAEYGVRLTGPVNVDMAAVKARKDDVVHASRNGLNDWLSGTENLTLIQGHARFISDHRITVGDRTLEAPRIFLNVGGRAAMPDYPGIDDIEILTNSTILELTAAPRHLVVVGGGYIGLEFAQMFARFGSKVSIVERGPRLLKREDEDASQTVSDILSNEGIDIRLNADCIAFAASDNGPIVRIDCSDGATEIAGTHVLVAIGRQPNTDDLGLEATGIKTDDRGYIVTNERLETLVQGVWALGDCNGRGAFTHTAFNDFEIVADNLEGGNRSVETRVDAYALYTDPPLGRAGMSLAKAQESGHRVLIGKRPMTRVSRAKEKGESKGYMKVIVDADRGTILGGAIFGVGGDEAIHVLLDAIQSGMAYTDLKRTMHIHPTVSELIPTILAELEDAE